MKTLHRILCAGALLAGLLPAHAAGNLVIGPAPAGLAPGDAFDVDVRGAAFAENVVGGGFDLGFDPAQLRLDGVQVDTGVWEFISSNGQIDNAAGRLTDVYFNSFRPVLPTGDFAVATLHFTALAAGSSVLQLAESAFFPFASDAADVIAVDYGSATVGVSAVPEPAALGLWSAGLAMLALRLSRGRSGAVPSPTAGSTRRSARRR